MDKTIVLSATVAGFMLATSALADADDGNFDNDADYSGEYAKVVSAEPIYRTVRVSEPRKECWDERVVYQETPQVNDSYVMNNGIAGAVIGAIAGGVVGHQFGGGRGKDLATVAGALIGAGIGQRIAVERFGKNPQQQADAERVVYEERCKTVENTRTEQRIEGYNVNYRYNGRMYQTTTAQHPGSRLPVNVQVQPRGDFGNEFRKDDAISPYQKVSY